MHAYMYKLVFIFFIYWMLSFQYGLGVHSIVVALLSEKADIQYDPEQTNPDKLVGHISNLGFEASLIADQDGHQQGKINLIVSLLIQ